jgi:hypothetical protein
MRIVFFSPDYAIRNNRPAFGGAPYYRCILPAKALGDYGGHETYVSPTLIVHEQTGYMTGQTAISEIPDPDIFVIHSWPELGTDAIQRARGAGQIVIGDIDDLIWEIPKGHMAESLNTPEKNLQNMWDNFMACSALTVSTPYLKEWIEEHAAGYAPPVFVIRNAIDLRDFTYNSMRDKVRTIGWSGNPLWRADDLSLLRPWLLDFLLRHKLRFVHVGALPHASIADQLGIPKELLIERPFQTFEDYRQSNPIREMDIQLIPLVDCPFNRAKSNLKGLESAAWGVPFHATRFGEYESMYMNGPDPTWPSQLEHMFSRSLREEILWAQDSWARRAAISERWQDWETVYSEVATSRCTPRPSSPSSK